MERRIYFEKRVCEKHGDYEAEITEVLGHKFSAMCPECETEEKSKEAEELKKAEMKRLAEETEEARAALQAERKAMNLEPAYYNASIQTFIAETTEQKKAASTVQRLIDGEVQKIVMTGSNGTGKTHLACAAVRALKGRILTMYEISTAIRQTYTMQATTTELAIVQELASLPLLAIDEIGRTKATEAEAAWLSFIIDKRNARYLPLILISNKHILRDCTEKGCPNCLENHLGEDIMSRVNEGGVLLRFSGKDYRNIKNMVKNHEKTR